MNKFIHFLRFFSLVNCEKNYNQPALNHYELPAVPGDLLRFLVPRSDLGGVDYDRLQIRLLPCNAEEVLPQAIGTLRPQLGETSSLIRLRVNSAPQGEHRQFALECDVPTPQEVKRILSIGKPVLSSSEAGEFWAAANLTDGLLTSQIGKFGWSSDTFLTNPNHTEYVVVDLGKVAEIDQVILVPVTTQGYPIDFTIDVSDDYATWQTVVTRTNAVEVSTPQEFSINTRGRYVRVQATKLRYISAGDPYYRFQLVEVQVIGVFADTPKITTRTLGGTFKGQQTSLPDYVRAIRNFFINNPYTPVSVVDDGNELEIRFHHSERFKLGYAPVRVGLGSVIEYNTNQPALNARKLETITVASMDTFQVIVGDDIESGNVYKLGSISYTAVGNELPIAILKALGVSDGKLTVVSGTPVPYAVTRGSYVLDNTNRPRLELAYTGNNGGGFDTYQGKVAADVQPGNLYQISAPGMTTITKVASDNDTKATIDAFFNLVAVPQGQTPTITILPGVRTYQNTNNPVLTLTGKTTVASHKRDRYSIIIGSSIRRNNEFRLQDARVVAQETDTVKDIARKLGYATHPFTFDVPENQPVTAYAIPGLLYDETNIADIDVIEGATWAGQHAQVIAEVLIPDDLEPGQYSLVLWDSKAKKVVAQSNRLDVMDEDDEETALIRYRDDSSVFGYDYHEPGFFQQLRLPVYIGEGRIRQEENLWSTLNHEMVRDRTSGALTRNLTTRAMPESFHLALWAALKHRNLLIDHYSVRCEGDYQQSAPIGIQRLMNGNAILVETDFWSNKVAATNGGYVYIESVCAELTCWLENDGTLSRIKTNQVVVANAYRLMVESVTEQLEVIVYVNEVDRGRLLTNPHSLNRLDKTLMLDAGSKVRIEVKLVTVDSSVSKWHNHPVDLGEGAFGPEFNPDQFN
ncbi:discoidin domain-containing protein [Tellurirhabdus bombi]|uniref:discoidin domain-containing protein n=1 Tax=Tellurirhabdus bombi TaxID=2907205 RepID=UPI001F457E6D|nr:discoidin domain-containing protein [Tellurirhabdus bombi]